MTDITGNLEGPAMCARWQCTGCAKVQTDIPSRLVIEEEIPLREGKQVRRAIYLCLPCAKRMEAFVRFAIGPDDATHLQDYLKDGGKL